MGYNYNARELTQDLGYLVLGTGIISRRNTKDTFPVGVQTHGLIMVMMDSYISHQMMAVASSLHQISEAMENMAREAL